MPNLYICTMQPSEKHSFSKDEKNEEKNLKNIYKRKKLKKKQQQLKCNIANML